MSVAVESAPIPARGACGVVITDAIEALLKAKRAANYRPTYITRLRQYLALFCRGRESWQVAEFTVEVIEKWFEERSEPFASRAANTGILSALFGFCVRRGWIAVNPCDQMEKVRLDPKPPTILTPNQCALLMDYARRRKPGQLAFYTLALFAGVRPDELARLGWGNVDLENGIVTIDAAASKVRRRRIVTLEPETLVWLRYAKEKGGRLPVRLMTRRRYLHQACLVLRFEHWPQDALRHTGASYLLARHRDPGKVAYLLGNSARILQSAYMALVNQRECDQFWSFTPDSPRPVQPKLNAPDIAPVVLPTDWGVTIAPEATRFARAEAALVAEPTLRRLGKAKQLIAGYHGGVTGKRYVGDRIDTIGELGRIAGCSRQTMQYVKAILRHGDPDVVDRCRKGKASIHGTYRKVVAEEGVN